MGVGKTNIDLDGQLTNFPGQTQRVEAQGLAQLVASSSRPLVVAASKFLHWRHQALDELRIREQLTSSPADQPSNHGRTHGSTPNCEQHSSRTSGSTGQVSPA